VEKDTSFQDEQIARSEDKSLNQGKRQQRAVFLFEPANAQIYITKLSLYIMFTPTCFDISVSSAGSLKNLCLAKLCKFL
jgi:hypothetical protein